MNIPENMKEITDLASQLVNPILPQMEDFVTFEIATVLKEKGFDWETSNVYERNIIACRYEDYPKPTISQVLKWLRDEKNIILVLNPYFIEDCGLGWDCDVWIDGKYIHYCEDYKTYEEAALAGIEYVLYNLI